MKHPSRRAWSVAAVTAVAAALALVSAAAAAPSVAETPSRTVVIDPAAASVAAPAWPSVDPAAIDPTASDAGRASELAASVIATARTGAQALAGDTLPAAANTVRAHFADFIPAGTPLLASSDETTLIALAGDTATVVFANTSTAQATLEIDVRSFADHTAAATTVHTTSAAGELVAVPWNATLDTPVAGAGAHAFTFAQAIGPASPSRRPRHRRRHRLEPPRERPGRHPRGPHHRDAQERRARPGDQCARATRTRGHAVGGLPLLPADRARAGDSRGRIHTPRDARIPPAVRAPPAVYTADGTILGWSNVLISAPVTGTDPTTPVAAAPGASGALPTSGIEIASAVLLSAAGLGAIAIGVGTVRRARRR